MTSRNNAVQFPWHHARHIYGWSRKYETIDPSKQPMRFPQFYSQYDNCKYKLFGLLSTLLACLMRNYFPKRPSGAPLHTLSRLYDVLVGFVTHLLFWGCVLFYLRSPKGGCCSISDDLFCSFEFWRAPGTDGSGCYRNHKSIAV